MSELHSVIAVLPSLKGTANQALTSVRATFKNRQHQFGGHTKTYRPLDNDGQAEQPEESPMTMTVGEELAHFKEQFTPFLDASYQVDLTNTKAKADVIVDGLELKDVPATFLLQLEKHIGSMRQSLGEVPVLDQKFAWTPEDYLGKGVYKSKEEITYKSKKQTQSKILFEGNEHHPPEIDKWQEDVRIGTWTTQRFSGMITVQQKIALFRKLDKLQQALKRARSQANKEKHSTGTVAEQIFKYLFEGLPLEQ
ncbi:hypothetical protein LCGC14_0810290 [marine sediment metagenome]|uniref:Uncharacterized protein n=1 Tax=marine sediment metagenome TaxID=412755 RepID=A0A0F9PRI1_9ZZZZ